eukprot:Rhum_TRINITY_DN21188_c0_g1::Rhum_TRINITY_DN21188_c0_g1_i1::g.173395::m.173395
MQGSMQIRLFHFLCCLSGLRPPPPSFYHPDYATGALESKVTALLFKRLRVQLLQQTQQLVVASEVSHLGLHPRVQAVQLRQRVGERVRLLDQRERVLLDGHGFRALLDDLVQAFVVAPLAPRVDGVDDRERVLALRDVLAERLRLVVAVRVQVEVVVEDLEVLAHHVQQRAQVLLEVREHLQHPHAQPEEAARLVSHHGQVLGLGRHVALLAEEDVLSLPSVQVAHLVREQLDQRAEAAFVALWHQDQRLAKSEKVDVVGAVDGGGDPEDAVRHRHAAPHLRPVLDVVDDQRRRVQLADNTLHNERLLLRHQKPHVERVDHPLSEALPLYVVYVLERREEIILRNRAHWRHSRALVCCPHRKERRREQHLSMKYRYCSF